MKLTKEEKKQRNHALLIPLIFTLLTTAFLLACNFAPLVTAKDNQTAYLMNDPHQLLAISNTFTRGDIIHVSLIEFFQLHWEIYAVDDELETRLVTFFFSIVLVMPVVAMFFTILKKPLLVIMFDIFSFLTYILPIRLMKNEINFSNYSWGIGMDLYYISFILIFISSFWLFRTKIRSNREIRSERALTAAREI